MPCPAAPQSEDSKELGFTPRPMVRWYSPSELLRTGVKILLSSLFGSYADKREVLALQDIEEYDYSSSDELWIDYVADVGDGFDSTYTMASLLAYENLQPQGAEAPLPRGRILVFGGDQVYPTATRELYNDRLFGPYRASLPWVEVEKDEDAPHLYAIPGNHDWYDGLTSFNRLFTQGRWLGGRKSQQKRSYFALALPHGWWLWGVDVQLESDIDQPQLEYFKRIAKSMAPGSRVILCTAEPSWIHPDPEHPGGLGNLAYLERIVVKSQGTVPLSLAGDLHHYARYSTEVDGGHHKITAGGGGAFYHETHNLPPSFDFDTPQPNGDAMPIRYGKRRTFPEAGASRRLILRNLLFAGKNWYFAGFLGLFYLLYAWVVESASLKERWLPPGASFLERIWDQTPSFGGFGKVFEDFRMVSLHSPSSFILFLVLFLGSMAYLEPNKSHPKGVQLTSRILLGGLHGIAHLLALICVIWTVGYVNHRMGFETVKDFGHAACFITGITLLGGLFGGSIWGIYLLLTNLLFGCHTNAGSSAVKIKDYKNFLRLRLTRDGLDIHAIGVPKVNRDWKLDRQAKDGQPWFVPQEGQVAELAELLEVVRIPRRAP